MKTEGLDCQSPKLFGLGIDIESAALEVARKNAQRHLDAFTNINQSNWVCEFHQVDFGNLHNFEKIANREFNILLCNPPYLTPTVILEPEDVRIYEPPRALYAEEEGYQAYRKLSESLEFARREKKQNCR